MLALRLFTSDTKTSSIYSYNEAEHYFRKPENTWQHRFLFQQSKQGQRPVPTLIVCSQSTQASD